ncbi:hypothetical protein [Caballeronia sp. dw_19]|uniref:hypothetical protein n=1 Tax=Caballeronia sp. dw_19 TaxID=2719791 RepID=UPI001BCEDED4|nr:hypothetical protein [Caballeronia sp. dw_19]
MIKRLALPVLLTSILTACGGGGNSSSSTPPPPDSFVGIYNGTTSDSRVIESMVLTNGTYYYFYSGLPTTTVVPASGTTAATTTTTTNPVGGVIIGTGSGKGGSFSSSTALDYQVQTTGLSTGVAASTLSASYVTAASMSGTITHNGDGIATTFSSTYDSALSSATPALTTVAGIYTGTVGTTAGGTEDLTMSVLPTGAVTGASASGCFFSGTIAPHLTNNAYDLNITFAATTCTYNSLNMLGMGLYDSTTTTLYGATVKADNTGGIVFVVSKVKTS